MLEMLIKMGVDGNKILKDSEDVAKKYSDNWSELVLFVCMLLDTAHANNNDIDTVDTAQKIAELVKGANATEGEYTR